VKPAKDDPRSTQRSTGNKPLLRVLCGISLRSPRLKALCLSPEILFLPQDAQSPRLTVFSERTYTQEGADTPQTTPPGANPDQPQRVGSCARTRGG
jgi:hypothetical protein